MAVSEAPTSWIIGNLDCESDWASAAAHPGVAPASSPPPLPERVLRAISSLATLLRAFCREGDALWTPRPVDPRRLVEQAGIPGPSLRSGDLPHVTRALVWGQTARLDGVGPADEPPSAAREPASGPLRDLLRGTARSSAASSVAASDRGFCLELAGELGCRLPASRLVASPVELIEHLRGGGLAAGAEWVLKAPFSAAGRWRCRGRGLPAEGSASFRAARNLIERFGRAVCEPWLERSLDFGACAVVDEEGYRLIGIHCQTVDGAGRFRGIALPLCAPAPAALTAAEIQRIESTVGRVAGRLRGLGYRGPLAVDGWRYRTAGGTEALHPLGEINARLSFGFVARGLVERLAPGAVVRDAREARLRIARTIPDSCETGVSILPLLTPADEDPTAAWLELDSTSE